MAVLLFTVIMLAVGAFTAEGVERAIEQWPAPSRRAWASVLPILPLVLFFPILVPAVVAGLVALAIQRVTAVEIVWRSRVLTLIGVALLTLTGLWNGLPTAAEVGKILT